jgi:hypothetical protein
MTKKPGKRLRRGQRQAVPPEVHPLVQIHGWKSTSAWYRSFGGDANYRAAMSKVMNRQHGIGAITFAVERAIESHFPNASDEEWQALADQIVREVIHPVQEENGVWRIYPVVNVDRHFGPRESESYCRPTEPQ